MKDWEFRAINKIKALAKKDIEELKRLVENVPFEDAFKKLDGHNLEGIIVLNKVTEVWLTFDCNFNNITATIRKGDKNKCVVIETACDFYVTETEPIHVVF